MAQHNGIRTKSASRRKPDEAKQTTRQRLLEAAGQVFADKGFSAATGKEIAALAGVNTAAVNYYFGGVDELYAAVIQEARDRLIKTEEVVAAIAGKTDATAKLEAVIGLLVPAITRPAASSWPVRVLGREIVAPSPAIETLLNEVTIRVGIMRSIVAELMGLPAAHPAVTRGIISAVAPFLMLLIYDRRVLRRLFPDLTLTPQDNAAIVRHMVQFTLAGLAAVARDAQVHDPA